MLLFAPCPGAFFVNGSGIPPVTTVLVFQSTYLLLPVIGIRAVLAHEMLIHQVIIDVA